LIPSLRRPRCRSRESSGHCLASWPERGLFASTGIARPPSAGTCEKRPRSRSARADVIFFPATPQRTPACNPGRRALCTPADERMRKPDTNTFSHNVARAVLALAVSGFPAATTMLQRRGCEALPPRDSNLMEMTASTCQSIVTEPAGHLLHPGEPGCLPPDFFSRHVFFFAVTCKATHPGADTPGSP